MKISHDIRDAAGKGTFDVAEKGMAEMAEKYRDGGDLYMPVEKVAPSEAAE